MSDARARRKAANRGRAVARAEFVAARAGQYDAGALAEAMATRVAEERPGLAEAQARAARVFPIDDTLRWVPLGPSVVRRSAAIYGFTRTTGRVRDLRVSDDGRRAYAAAARGGLWYTDDAGGMWTPVGGWAERATGPGGTNNAQASGCLNVAFGATAADDFVMVGTGELQGFGRPPNRPSQGGVGVLAARGPVVAGLAPDPWEPEAGRAVFQGLGCFGLARDPAATPGRETGADVDRVLVGTSQGLFLGTRRPAAAPHGGEFTWVLLPALGDPLMGLPPPDQPFVTDVVWLPGGAHGRIVVAVALDVETVETPAQVGSGVAFSDDLGATFTWVVGLDPTLAAAPIIGRMSLSRVSTVPPAPAPDRLYVLGERRPAPAPDEAAVWVIDPISAAAPSATLLAPVPEVWVRSTTTGKNQRDYDQAIAVDDAGGTDRIYLGGNYHLDATRMRASLWCLDVVGGALVPATGVSRPGTVVAGGDGADPSGLIGDGVHADVHTVRLVGDAAPNRQVWVSTDGGVSVSTLSGRAGSFAPRATGLAALEVNFAAPHPTSTQFVAGGTQDNGRHIRVGDVVWEDTMPGDAGGVVFHPIKSELLVSQVYFNRWRCAPPGGFVPPLQTTDAVLFQREADLSAFYSGAAAIKRTTISARLAIGSNRVWLTDNLGIANNRGIAIPCTWAVLPFSGGQPSNPRPGGADPVAEQDFGVPVAPPPAAAPGGGAGPLGPILTQKWLSTTTLVVVFLNGVVRYSEDPATGAWTTRVLVAPPGVAAGPLPIGAPATGTDIFFSDVAPVPGSDDFYLVTTGDPAVAATETCLYYHLASDEFFATGLRTQLAPVDPAYASVVDPFAAAHVYVGTVTGVWHGERIAGPPASGAVWPHVWTTRVNGLPQALVQDLHVWHDPAAPPGGPRLLRAATQSRGIWELDVAAAAEPRRTYLKVHAHDDRRRLPTPMKDPSKPPTDPDISGFASSDIMIRPRPGAGIAPPWPLPPTAAISNATAAPYDLWTFQTAFRWHAPSVTANGEWSDTLAQMVAHYRSTKPALAPAEPRITQAVWDDVVGDTRLSAAGTISADPADPLAVYRPPWHSPAALAAVPTELDLLESVKMPRTAGDVAHVFRELSTIDVLVHHRDTNPVPAGDAFVFLFWRLATLDTENRAADASSVRPYVMAAVAGLPLPGLTDGWEVVLTGGSPRHSLPITLDARMPRAVSIDFDTGVASSGQSLILLAVAGSSADQCGEAPLGLPATPTAVDLARHWPYAAVRLAQVSNR